MTTKQPTGRKQKRLEKSADALRQNLLKRKQQTRARARAPEQKEKT